MRFPIRTNYVIPGKITATHASFGRFIVADHDIHVRCDYACFQTFPRAFYVSNFATQRLWILVCLILLKPLILFSSLEIICTTRNITTIAAGNVTYFWAT